MEDFGSAAKAVIDAIEKAYADFIADLIVENTRRYKFHIEKFELLLQAIHELAYECYPPDETMKLHVPEYFQRFALIGYSLSLLVHELKTQS